MRIRMHGTTDAIPAQARARFDRIVRLTLGRATADLASTRVALARSEAAHAAEAWSCRLAARRDDGRRLRVEAFGRDVDEAVRRAARRLARRLHDSDDHGAGRPSVGSAGRARVPRSR